MLETIVTREDVAGTYPDGAEDLNNYERAIILSKQHTVTEVAKELGLQMRRVRYWIVGREGKNGMMDSMPKSVRCVNYLEEKGWIPFSEENAYFKEINILSSWLDWSGNIMLGTQIAFSTHLPKSEWNKSDGKRLKTVEECVEKLSVPYEYTENALRLKEHGYLSRLFVSIGVPSNSKQDNLPDLKYLDKCSRDANYNFIRVLFSTRMSRVPNREYTINLITNRKETRAREHLQSAAYLMSSFFKESALSYRIERRKDAEGGIYFLPKICMGLGEFKKITAKYPCLLELTR